MIEQIVKDNNLLDPDNLSLYQDFSDISFMIPDYMRKIVSRNDVLN
jgi:hypothetical protein